MSSFDVMYYVSLNKCPKKMGKLSNEMKISVESDFLCLTNFCPFTFQQFIENFFIFVVY